VVAVLLPVAVLVIVAVFVNVAVLADVAVLVSVPVAHAGAVHAEPVKHVSTAWNAVRQLALPTT
jgi:hypothetical protein